MRGYDSYLLRGSDDFPPDEPTIRDVIRAARRHPYEFMIEGDEFGAMMCGNPARRHPVPNNARARRLRLRIFKRLVRGIEDLRPSGEPWPAAPTGAPYIDDLDC